MPRLVSTLIRSQIALLHPLLQKIDLATQRKMQDALGELGAKAVSENVRYENELFERFEAVRAIPQDPTGKAALYLHGGAYVSGSLSYAKGFGGFLAEQTKRETLCVGYRLAPEDQFPSALEDALDAYRMLLTRYKSSDIAFAGESAGGGLCFALALKLKKLSLPMPSKIVAVSPWTDLTLSGGSCVENKDKDPVLDRESLLSCAEMYATDDTANPFVSPLFGDLCEMPPSLLIAGTHEILLDDTLRLSERLIACGNACEILIAEGMWHVYVLYGIPEAHEAMDRIIAFLAAEEGKIEKPI